MFSRAWDNAPGEKWTVDHFGNPVKTYVSGLGNHSGKRQSPERPFTAFGPVLTPERFEQQSLAPRNHALLDDEGHWAPTRLTKAAIESRDRQLNHSVAPKVPVAVVSYLDKSPRVADAASSAWVSTAAAREARAMKSVEKMHKQALMREVGNRERRREVNQEQPMRYSWEPSSNRSNQFENPGRKSDNNFNMSQLGKQPKQKSNQQDDYGRPMYSENRQSYSVPLQNQGQNDRGVRIATKPMHQGISSIDLSRFIRDANELMSDIRANRKVPSGSVSQYEQQLSAFQQTLADHQEMAQDNGAHNIRENWTTQYGLPATRDKMQQIPISQESLNLQATMMTLESGIDKCYEVLMALGTLGMNRGLQESRPAGKTIGKGLLIDGKAKSSTKASKSKQQAFQKQGISSIDATPFMNDAEHLLYAIKSGQFSSAGDSLTAENDYQEQLSTFQQYHDDYQAMAQDMNAHFMSEDRLKSIRAALGLKPTASRNEVQRVLDMSDQGLDLKATLDTIEAGIKKCYEVLEALQQIQVENEYAPKYIFDKRLETQSTPQLSYKGSGLYQVPSTFSVHDKASQTMTPPQSSGVQRSNGKEYSSTTYGLNGLDINRQQGKLGLAEEQMRQMPRSQSKLEENDMPRRVPVVRSAWPDEHALSLHEQRLTQRDLAQLQTDTTADQAVPGSPGAKLVGGNWRSLGSASGGLDGFTRQEKMTTQDIARSRELSVGQRAVPGSVNTKLIGGCWRQVMQPVEAAPVYTDYYGPVGGGKEKIAYYGRQYNDANIHAYYGK